MLEFVPIHPVKKGMPLNLLNILRPQPIHKVLTKEAFNKVIRLLADHPLLLADLRPLNSELQYIVQHFLNSVPTEGSDAY